MAALIIAIFNFASANVKLTQYFPNLQYLITNVCNATTVFQEADLVVAPLTITAPREEVMDFVTEPYMHDYYVAIYKLPTAAETKWQVVFKPFRLSVWLVTALCIPAVSVVVYLVSHRSQLYTGNRSIELSTVSGAFWYCFGAVLTQGKSTNAC